MKRISSTHVSIVIVAFAIAAVAVLAAVVIDGNSAKAYPDGWAGGCGGCHDGFSDNPSGAPAAHNVPGHSAIYPSNCSACHTGAATVGTADAAKCAACHGGVDALATVHDSFSDCGECHEVSTTTTTAAPTTTTIIGPTTTTLPGQTTTTVRPTTTTIPPTTTTVRPTTTTVRPTTTTTEGTDDLTPTG